MSVMGALPILAFWNGSRHMLNRQLFSKLNDRQKLIVDLLRHYSPTEIHTKAGMSKSQVGNQLHKLRKFLGVTTTVEAMEKLGIKIDPFYTIPDSKRIILDLFIQGLEPPEIAEKIQISRQAVSASLKSLMRRAGVDNKMALALSYHDWKKKGNGS